MCKRVYITSYTKDDVREYLRNKFQVVYDPIPLEYEGQNFIQIKSFCKANYMYMVFLNPESMDHIFCCVDLDFHNELKLEPLCGIHKTYDDLLDSVASYFSEIWRIN